MEFSLSKRHLLLRDLYRKFAEEEVKPLAEELDEQERFPVETVKKLVYILKFQAQMNSQNISVV